MAMLKKCLAFLIGFLQEHTSSSSARLVAILCAVVGALIGVAAAAVVAVLAVQLWRHTLDAKTLASLSELLKNLSWPIGSFIGGGAVAILARSRTGVDAAPPAESPSNAGGVG